MVLICGNAADRLIHGLLKLAPELALTTKLLEEGELFGSCPFAFERQSLRTQGFLQIQGQRVNLEDLQGVVLRLSREWWPSEEFDLQDQMFVYHETIASWFALFDALKCPLVNRFGPGWWLQDLAYPLELRMSLARAIDMATSEIEETDLGGGQLRPTRRDPSEGVASVYRSGGRTLCRPGCAPELIERLAACEAALSGWEQDTGIALSRIDFERSRAWRVKWVEVVPLLEGEPEELVRDMTNAVLRRMAA